MYKNKKLYLFFGLLTLTLCLTSFTHISYANDIDSGETEVGITFSKSPIKPKDPGIDEIPSGPSPSIPTKHNKFLPKTGEVINAFLVALGVGLSFLFFLFKMMNRRKNTQNTMEEII